ILRAMYDSPQRHAFVDALPLAGHTGTLRSRFVDGPARGHVRAKTGYISRVVCLSGYVQRPDPAASPLIFSVMLNDFTCDDGKAKAAADAFVQRLAAAVGW
ncbi:MAG: D-alanyl-D-alanine carboxypeptidase, partial [Planctomycetota bacterium]